MKSFLVQERNRPKQETSRSGGKGPASGVWDKPNCCPAGFHSPIDRKRGFMQSSTFLSKTTTSACHEKRKLPSQVNRKNSWTFLGFILGSTSVIRKAAENKYCLSKASLFSGNLPCPENMQVLALWAFPPPGSGANLLHLSREGFCLQVFPELKLILAEKHNTHCKNSSTTIFWLTEETGFFCYKLLPIFRLKNRKI